LTKGAWPWATFGFHYLPRDLPEAARCYIDLVTGPSRVSNRKPCPLRFPFPWFGAMFELFDVDCYGVAYVAEAYSSIEEAKSMLEEDLSYAETPEQAHRIQMYLTQVYEEMTFI